MLGINNTQIINNVNNFLNRWIAVLALIFSIAVFFCGVFFLVLPKYKEIREDIKSAGQKENVEYTERYQYYSQLEELSQEFNKINPSDIEKIQMMIPKEKYQEELLAYLEEFTLRNGLIITSANVSAEEGGGNQPGAISRLNVSLNITGVDYKGLKIIINEIENNLRIMDIESLSFSPESRSASFNIISYYLNN